MLTRRMTLALGSAAALAPSGCARPPSHARDVIAAGQPAAVLIWAVARERLAGWPVKPHPDCLTGLSASAAALPELGRLSGPGRKADTAALSTLHPRLILDYGDTRPDVVETGRQASAQLGVPWALIDGALTRIPEAFRQAGRLLDEAARGESLAEDAEGVLAEWRASGPGPSFYYARGADGLKTGFRGALATEVLDGAGWINVAVGGDGIGPATLEQVADWDPEVLVTLNADFAHAVRGDIRWRTRRNGARRRLLLLPDRPFGWIDRPPSVNRLLGCAWLAHPDDGPTARLALLSRRLYGMAPAEIQMPKWLI